MEEFVILYYGNFSMLGGWAREYTQQTSCSNRVANWTLYSQLFSDKLHREHLGYSTAQKQEWGLFLLEYMLHYTATM